MARVSDEIREIIEQFGRLEVYDVDGGACDLSFGPPVNAEVLEALRKGLDGPVPDELVAYAEAGSRMSDLWMEAVGLNASPAGVRRGLGGSVRGVGNCLPFGGDGFGNGLYLQVRPSGCRVWYLPHDPAAIVLMGRSLLDFFERRLEATQRYKQVTDQWMTAVEADDFDRELPAEPTAPEEDFRRVDPIPASRVESLDSAAFNHLRDRHDGSARAVDLREVDLPAGLDLTRSECRRYRWQQFGEVLVGLGAADRGPAAGPDAADGEDPPAPAPWWKFW